MFTLAEVRKGLYPFPVYEAHYADGTSTRLSIWSHKDKPLDVAYGRRNNDKLTKNKGKTFSHGFIEWKGVKVPEADHATLYQPMKAKRVAKPTADVISLLEAARKALENVRCNDVELLDKLASFSKAA